MGRESCSTAQMLWTIDQETKQVVLQQRILKIKKNLSNGTNEYESIFNP